jgi:hypothetical protein
MRMGALIVLLALVLSPVTAYAFDEPTLDAFVQAYGAVKAAKEGADPQVLNLALAGFFGLVLRHAISVYQAWRPSSSRGRDFLPYLCLGLGCLFALFARYEVGVGWGAAATYGLTGPLAVAWHEYVAKHADIKAAPTEATGPTQGAA